VNVARRASGDRGVDDGAWAAPDEGVRAVSDGEWARGVADADVVVVGPMPPLRGGIAQHGERLGEAVLAAGLRAAAVSFRRLYPSAFFPGRTQRTESSSPAWSREILDVLGPASWLKTARLLEASHATVVLEWWHPVTAAAFAVATRRVPRERLVAVCHNAIPHEPVPAAASAARLVLSRCGRVVCHSRAEADRLAGLLGAGATQVTPVPLPCLVSETDLAARPRLPELAGLAASSRLVVAAGHVRPYKDIALLVRAWRRAKRPAEARLVVVGESYLSRSGAREVQAAAGSDGSILFVNRYVEDAELVQFLRSAEVVVAVHRRASQSGLLPLARELGAACLVSDAGGLAEQAGRDGGRSEVVPAGDEHALAAALERRLAAPPAARRQGSGSPESRAAGWRRVLDAIVDDRVEAFPGAARPTARPGDTRRA
jgi:D-inositol-3-phosphate glycosyltransferase